jgi:cell division protease FtsH
MNATTNITEIENVLYFTGNLVFSFINGSMQMVNIGQNYTKDDFETLVRDKSSKGSLGGFLLQIFIYIWLFFIFKQRFVNTTGGSDSIFRKNKYFYKSQDDEKNKEDAGDKKDKEDKEGNDNSDMSDGGKTNDLLGEIIGLESVKEEIKYYMDFIVHHEKYAAWDVKLPKGILLAGLPGTGKTLLVKTIAKYLNIPVISCAGSDFVEKYVGVGAKRVRELFSEAKEQDRCIIFIDEIDAIGSRRNMGDNSERASTLNQILVEMDGFDISDGVIIFAATNMVKYLDPALVRSGRFDKKIYFDPPNFLERKNMFKLYLEGISLHKKVSFDILSERTAGLVGADIANITNQAKLNAIQKRGAGNVRLTLQDIQLAIDEVMIGREKKERQLDKDDLNRVAHHEAGHAFMGFILKGAEPPVKVSIVPRGEAALGFSQQKPTLNMLMKKSEVLNRICVLMGGRCAEKVFFGEVSTGAADDIEKISQLLYRYFVEWGMCDKIGAVNIDVLGVIGDKVNGDIFNELIKLSSTLEDFVFKKLKEHKSIVGNIAKQLLKRETIDYRFIKKHFPCELEDSVIYGKEVGILGVG